MKSQFAQSCQELSENVSFLVIVFFHVKKMAEADQSLEDETDTEHKQSPLAQKTIPETGEILKN